MNPSHSNNDGKRVSSVQRAFEVINVLRKGGTMRIDDVGEALEIPTSTAHVHLKTLESVGYAIRDKDGYRLGLRFLRDGITVQNRVRVYNIAKPEIDELATTTGEAANLGVEENGKRVLLYQSEGSHAVYDNAPIGEYTYMHWTALGKAILAKRSSEYVENYIDTYGLPAKTENTITDPDQFYRELSKMDKQGFALEDEERREGIRSIAVPLIVEAVVIGSISLSGPRERLNDDRIQDELLSRLRDAANVIEVKYAYE